MNRHYSNVCWRGFRTSPLRPVSLIVSFAIVIVGFSCAPVKYYEKDNLVAKHFIAFHTALSTDPETARVELAQAAKFRFKEHPLTDEWVALYFLLARDGKGTLLQLIHVNELTIRMLSETDAKGRAREIEIISEALERNKQDAKNLESEGQDPSTYEVTFEVKIAEASR